MDQAVAAVFETYPQALRERLMALREMIQATAAETQGVGPLQETLKWGQISYLTARSGSGTTIRIDLDKASQRPALYVNCKTDLLAQYRALYPDGFDYQGDRGVVLDEAPDDAALRHMVALALTYHLKKK